MLPRYFVYHQEAGIDSPEASAWVERERKLLKIILLPSIIAVWAFGIALAFAIGAWDQAWLHAKLLFVLILSGYHGWLSVYAKKLARGERPLEGKKLRMLNEVPGIVVAIIVVLVVVKPF
jgi:putative membrane protein